MIVIIGFAGSAFNLDAEKEMTFGAKLDLGPYTLVNRSYTQEENPNYSSEKAIIEVFRGGKLLQALYPDSRFFTSTQQQQHVPAVRSTVQEDLYIVYEGQNPETGRPIIKAHLNFLVSWIWVGWLVMVLGTVAALVPNAAPVRATVPARLQAVPVGAGD
jgi:cytochrome c-type biogenesis protein CcmF